MGSEILRRESQDAIPTSTPEIEFALVLSRMIDSVKNDPRHMRETVYELARHKLQEQFTHEDVKEMRNLSNALEVAIQGVEAFARKNDRTEEPLRKPESARGILTTAADSGSRDSIRVSRPMPPVLDVPVSKSIRRRTSIFHPWRVIALLAVVFAIAVAVQQRGTISNLRQTTASLLTVPPPATIEPAVAPVVSQQAVQTPSEPVVVKPQPLVPTSYGIYAVSKDRLYELEPLPGSAPDIRVAISSAITTPSRTVLPDGYPSFIVYWRGSATSAADHAEVRVVARVTRAMSFDSAGKALVSNEDDSWVIRNISIPYRSAPNRNDPDMYDIQSGNPEQPLSPGRYALIVRGRAYDFSVAGDVTDPKQCLERTAAANGQFYSECRKP